jgi:hypothetical protein
MSQADDIRTRIAAEQRALVSALLNSGPPPDGFDSRALHATTTSLVQKRMRTVARTWANLAQSLGPRLEALFEAYAQNEPLPLVGGSIADGRCFVRWLAARDKLSDACRLQAMAVDLRYRATTQGLVPRRWLGLQIAFLRESRRLMVGIWLPVLGERWLRLPLGAERDVEREQIRQTLLSPPSIEVD